MTYAAALTLSQTSPGFCMSAVWVFWKHWGKRRNCLWQAISPFPTVFSTLWELSAIFMKFKIVVCKLFQSEGVKNLFGKGLSNPSVEMCLQYKSFENNVGKGEIACNKQFLLFPQCFLLFENFPPFSWNLKLSSANSFSLKEWKTCLGKG